MNLFKDYFNTVFFPKEVVFLIDFKGPEPEK